MLTFRHMHKIALAAPCFLAEETAHPRYHRIVPGVASVIVTINDGYE